MLNPDQFGEFTPPSPGPSDGGSMPGRVKNGLFSSRVTTQPDLQRAQAVVEDSRFGNDFGSMVEHFPANRPTRLRQPTTANFDASAAAPSVN